jgi:TonB family protein
VTPAAEIQIERDLVRWRRARWISVIIFVLLAQGALLLLTPRPVNDLPPKHPKEPTLNFIRFSAPSEWLALQDSTLFASANPRGFSGLAWIHRKARAYLAEDALRTPAFLAFSQARPEENLEFPAPVALPSRAEVPEPTPPPSAAPNPPVAQSHLRVAGFSGRQLVQGPAIPVQYATDAVRPSVVEALVDGDGLVFSARIMTSSGSRSIDNSALDLAKKVRFAPSYSRVDAQLSTGKLIFDWSAVEPGQTNTFPAKAPR